MPTWSGHASLSKREQTRQTMSGSSVETGESPTLLPSELVLLNY